MTHSLPPNPSLTQLKHQAKDILKAHRDGDPNVCQTLRLLRRFERASDREILAADLALHEVQFSLAMDYGFKSWDELKSRVQDLGRTEVRPASLDKLSRTEYSEAPIYLAQMVKAYVQALNHAGTRIDCSEFAAATAWAFSFSYKYEDIFPAFVPIRGNPKKDGQFEIFRFLPERLGYDYEVVPVAEKQRLWDFIRRHIDTGTPVLTEQWDGGLFYGYRTNEGKREVWFVWDDEPQWLDIEELQAYEVCALVRKRPEPDRKDIWTESLQRAVRVASPHDERLRKQRIPQGLKALRKYLKDVKDPEKDFAKTGDWFCWATFSRLCARECCATWLRMVADALTEPIRAGLLAAAAQYGRAADHYDRYRREVGAGDPDVRASLQERARTPERIAVIAPILEQGIAEETAGLEELKKVVPGME